MEFIDAVLRTCELGDMAKIEVEFVRKREIYTQKVTEYADIRTSYFSRKLGDLYIYGINEQRFRIKTVDFRTVIKSFKKWRYDYKGDEIQSLEINCKSETNPDIYYNIKINYNPRNKTFKFEIENKNNHFGYIFVREEVTQLIKDMGYNRELGIKD